MILLQVKVTCSQTAMTIKLFVYSIFTPKKSKLNFVYQCFGISVHSPSITMSTFESFLENAIKVAFSFWHKKKVPSFAALSFWAQSYLPKILLPICIKSENNKFPLTDTIRSIKSRLVKKQNSLNSFQKNSNSNMGKVVFAKKKDKKIKLAS